MIGDWFRKSAPPGAITIESRVAEQDEAVRIESARNRAAAKQAMASAECRFFAAEDLHTLLEKTLARLSQP